MSRYEAEHNSQPLPHQELDMHTGLDALLAELSVEGLTDQTALDRIAQLEVGDHFSAAFPNEGVFTVERLNANEYVLISSDRVEPVDTGFEQERTIYRQIFQQQLEFVRLLQLEHHQPISELLNDYTNVVDNLGFELGLSEEVAAQLPELKTEVIERIADLPDIDQPDWTQRAWKIILELYAQLEQSAELVSPDFHEPRIGGLIYQFSEADETTAIDFGLSEHERHLTLHFPISAVERARNRRVLPAHSAFREVANLIKSQNLDIVAITGASWLMGHPIAQRIGFQQTSVAQKPWKEMGYWLQLVDENGAMKPDVITYLHEHKQLPYDFTYGKIDRETFLQKYSGASNSRTAIDK